MTPEQYKAALEVLELARAALGTQPDQRHLQALLDLRATVEDIWRSHDPKEP